MKPNADIFELISSLDSNEKRYFKLFASKISGAKANGSKAYIRLFDEISSRKSYDEAEIKQNLADEIPEKNFAYTKNYLKEIILRSLAEFHTESSVDRKLQNLIMNCKILFRKSLYSQYFETLKKAKSLALKHERYGYYLEILDMAKMITPKEELKTLSGNRQFEDTLEVLDKIKNMYEYSRIIRKLLLNYREIGTSRIAEHTEVIEEVLSEKYIRNESEIKSSRARETYNRINEIIFKMQADYSKSAEFSLRQIELIESTPAPFEDYIIDFKIEALASLVSSFIKLGRLNEAEVYLEKFRDSATGSEAQRIDNELHSSSLDLELNLKAGKTERSKELAAQLELLLSKYKNKIELDFELNMKFRIIVVLIGSGEFNAAAERINTLLSHPLLSTRTDIECYTRILNLIVHFELSNFTLLPYLIRSTYRYLLKRDKLFKLENVLISFIRKLTNRMGEEELVFMFRNLKREMDSLALDRYERNAFEYFDFPAWVERKLNN